MCIRDSGEIKTIKVDETVGKTLSGLYKSFTTDKYGVVSKTPSTYANYCLLYTSWRGSPPSPERP